MEKTKRTPAPKHTKTTVGRHAAPAAMAAEAERQRRDVELAHQRIGTTTEARCRWLLEEFIAHDPATLSTGELATLRDNLQALTGYGGLMEAGRRPRVGATLGGMRMDDPVLVDDAALRELWERVCVLTRAHRTPAPLPPGEEVLMMIVRGGPYLRLERRRSTEGLADQVVVHAARLLEACDRLRVCPECDRIFVARRRQERHPDCARRARDSRRPSRQKKGA